MKQGWMVVSPIKKNFQDTVYFGKLLGGQMAVAENNQTLQKMIQLMKSVSVCEVSFFTGFSDIEKEGHFVHEHTGEELDWDPWNRDQPNNYLQEEDCVVVSLGDILGDGFNDQSCSKEYCSILREAFKKKKGLTYGNLP